MFYSIRGKLIHVDKDFVAVECAGISYLIFVSLNTKRQLSNENEEIFLYTYTNIRENAVEIFGFKTKEEHSCFTLLTSVSGVGSKICLAILSELSPNDVFSAISSNTPKIFTKTSGVGLKLASRIILELKDKIKGLQFSIVKNYKEDHVFSSFTFKQAVNALLSLGYSKDQTVKVLSSFNDDSLSTEELIRLSLKSMARR